MQIVESTGAIVWAISLNTHPQSQLPDAQGIWLAPAWYRCPTPACLLHTGEGNTLCAPCLATRTFVWTWLLAAWQSLAGLYRRKPGTDPWLESIGTEHIEQLTRPGSGPYESEGELRLDLAYRYRVVRSLDIATTTARPPAEPGGQRGSWVEALASIDPALIFYDERAIPLRTRILRHPRYARYIAAHGTNQVEVRPHTRHIPRRADPKAFTRVRAQQPRQQGQ
ncbi:MAG TPA: hypothetical protein VGF67_11125 [Ktedonobacteraceae bacterium]